MAFNLGGEEVIPSVSVGTALYPDDADNADQLLKEADHAMFTDKASKDNSGRNQ